MEKSSGKSNLGLIVRTMNRPDFVIRQLNYYASLNSPHTIYYNDSSNLDNAKRIKDKIEELRGKLNIVHMTSPPGNIMDSMLQLLSAVKEKYVAFAGDDDYWVPDSLSECVEFLDKNPDYEAATGKSITFKMENNSVYGKIKIIYDYPKYPIEDGTASERLFNYLGPNPSTIAAAVIRTDHFLKYHLASREIKDLGIQSEFLISCLMVIAGKYKVTDKLGFAMQLHDSNSATSARDTFDWVIDNENWHSSYSLLKSEVVAALMAKDDISKEKAERVLKESIRYWMKVHLNSSYSNLQEVFNAQPSFKKKMRTKIASRLPILKKIYRFVVPLGKRGQLEYDVTRSDSKYYQDFKPILDSLTKKA